jgi:transposase
MPPCQEDAAASARCCPILLRNEWCHPATTTTICGVQYLTTNAFPITLAINVKEGVPLTHAHRRRSLTTSGLLHPHPEAVRAALFLSHHPFFFTLDKVQVKYEMLRAHLVDGVPVTRAAEEHGYSRAAFYLIADAFDDAGMKGLLDDTRGRRGPLKVTPEIIAFMHTAPQLSGAALARQVADRFGVALHRRTVERLRRW